MVPTQPMATSVLCSMKRTHPTPSEQRWGTQVVQELGGPRWLSLMAPACRAVLHVGWRVPEPERPGPSRSQRIARPHWNPARGHRPRDAQHHPWVRLALSIDVGVASNAPREGRPLARGHTASWWQSGLRLERPYAQAHASKPPGRRPAPGPIQATCHVPTDTGRGEQVCAHSAWGGGPARSVCPCTAALNMTRVHLLCARHGIECPTSLTLLKAWSF